VTEDRVVEAIKQLVAAGEYLDAIPGIRPATDEDWAEWA
jgi:hypothetical protein